MDRRTEGHKFPILPLLYSLIGMNAIKNKKDCPFDSNQPITCPHLFLEGARTVISLCTELVLFIFTTKTK